MSAEEKLRQEERELRRITDAIPQAIVVLDRSGMPMYANQATLDYTGLASEDVPSPQYRERILFHPEDLDRLREERKARSIVTQWAFFRDHPLRKS